MRLASPITAALAGLALLATAGQAFAQKMVFDVDIESASLSPGVGLSPYDAHFQQRFLTGFLHQTGSYTTNVVTNVSTQEAHAFGGITPLGNGLNEGLLADFGLDGYADVYATLQADGAAVRGGPNNPYGYTRITFDTLRSSVQDIGGGAFQGSDYRLTLDGFIDFQSMDGGLGNDLFDFTTLDYDGITALLTRMGPISYSVTATEGTYTPGASGYTYAASARRQYEGHATFNALASAAVPEPGAWALMILGFGGVGAVLRRRPRPTALAA